MLAPKLQPGDSIAVFSPSSPATALFPARYERAKAFLLGKGFPLYEGNLTGQRDYYRSGSIRARAQELNELLRNPSIKCIMAAIGGMNSNALLPYLDYDAILAHPKIIIGYSDVTALLLGIYAKTGLTTYYGPAVVASFGEFPPFVEDTFAYFANLLCQTPPRPYIFPTPKFWTEERIDWKTQGRCKTGVQNTLLTVSGGGATGRLIGGNLDTMQGIWGTEYMPAIRRGDILLVEDSMKDIATLERSFALLKLSGVFEKIGGLVLGKHEKFDDLGTGRKPFEVLCEVLGEVPAFPILAEFDCCHTHPMLTIPIGAQVTLDATRQQVILLWE